MADRTLLERLRHPHVDERSISGDEAERIRSVLRNLSRILNSRQGDSRTEKDFGLPDLAGMAHSLPEGIGTLSEAIERMVKAWEPRIRDPRVRFLQAVNEELALHFEIRGQLAMDDGGSRTVRFETVLASSGEFKLSN